MSPRNDVVEAATSTEVAVPDGGSSPVRSQAEVLAAVQAMGQGGMVYSTFDADDLDSKKRVLNAITESEPVADHLRETLNLKDFVIQAATMIDDQTGEERDVLRTILLTADGKAYHAISDGLFKSLQNYTAVLGHPSTWPAEGIAVMVDEVRSRRGYRFMTIKLA